MSEIEKVTQGQMRARDVRFLLKGKVEPDVSAVLEALAEKVHENEKNMTLMGQSLVQAMEIVSDLTGIAENMKKAYQDIKGIGKDADPEGKALTT